MSRNQKIERTLRIEAPLDTVWTAVSDFGGHDKWMESIAQSGPYLSWTGDANTVGSTRTFAIPGQPVFAEQLVRIDDDNHELSYAIVESPLPIQDHEATIALVAEGNATRASWAAVFESDDDTARALDDFMGVQTFESGLAGLKEYSEKIALTEPRR